jgi:hypothetical protein
MGMFSRSLPVLMLFVACTQPKQSDPFVPEPQNLRRLTAAQIENALRDVFGPLVLPPAIEADVAREESVSIGASHASYSPRGVELSRALADSVAEQALSEARRGETVLCVPAAMRDDACATAALERLGARLWRRPLAEDEVARLVTLVGEAATVRGDFFLGLRYGLIALLMAPDFLYRAELSEDAIDLASRLSFFLWDGPPDEALLAAALSGALDDRAGLRSEVQRLLADPRARRGVRAFLADWLQLRYLDDLVRDTELFPSFSPDLGRSAREEVLRTGEHLVFDESTAFTRWMTSRETFVNRRLAALYGVPFPVKEAPHSEFARIVLPADGARVGLLGTAAVLAMNAHPTSTSPTLRGKYLSQTFVCRMIPEPPVELNTGIPEPAEGVVTLRQRVVAHLENEGCSSCHKLTDPQGLGLEAFDAIGRFRTHDGGLPIDASGEWNGAHFKDARALAELMQHDERLPRCITKRLYRYALGHVDTADEKSEVDRLAKVFADSDYRLLALLEAIATSEAFRLVGEPREDEEVAR